MLTMLNLIPTHPDALGVGADEQRQLATPELSVVLVALLHGDFCVISLAVIYIGT